MTLTAIDYDQDGDGICLPCPDIPADEASKHLHLIRSYCNGNILDLGSGGHPIVPWAIQVELPDSEYLRYTDGRPQASIQWRGSAVDLPFKDGTVDGIHSSHLLEDFADWTPVLSEWDRVLKPGGYLMIAVPDHARFRAAVARGQGDNLSHRRESRVGELTENLEPLGYEVIFDGFVNDDPNEYSVLFIGRKR